MRRQPVKLPREWYDSAKSPFPEGFACRAYRRVVAVRGTPAGDRPRQRSQILEVLEANADKPEERADLSGFRESPPADRPACASSARRRPPAPPRPVCAAGGAQRGKARR